MNDILKLYEEEIKRQYDLRDEAIELHNRRILEMHREMERYKLKLENELKSICSK